MKYCIFILSGLLIIVAVLSVLFARRLLLKRLYRDVFVRKIGEFGDKYINMPFFPAYMVLEAAGMVVRLQNKHRHWLFKAVYAGKFNRLIEFIAQNNSALVEAFKIYFYPESRHQSIRRVLRTGTKNIRLLLISGLFLAIDNDFKNLRKIIDKLDALKLSKPEKALFLYLTAKLAMYSGDMFKASHDAACAAGLFKKQRAVREEAAAYMLLGEIYRFCAVYDVAQIMYESAAEIYHAASSIVGEAEVLAAKGMLLAGQERFAEAVTLFQQSRRIFKKLNLAVREGEIINQLALLNLMRGQFSASVKYARKAFEKHEVVRNAQGQAYSDELTAISFLQQESFSQAINYASAAQERYQQVKNYAAYFDAAFIEAEALFKLQKHAESAEMCRRIIKTARRHKTGFHIANVYALLGLIYIYRKNFKRAKGLFIRSLAQEHANERYSGTASDCVNLAQIEMRLGNNQMAKQYLSMALTEAQRYEDQDLCTLIKGQFEKLA